MVQGTGTGAGTGPCSAALGVWPVDQVIGARKEGDVEGLGGADRGTACGQLKNTKQPSTVIGKGGARGVDSSSTGVGGSTTAVTNDAGSGESAKNRVAVGGDLGRSLEEVVSSLPNGSVPQALLNQGKINVFAVRSIEVLVASRSVGNLADCVFFQPFPAGPSLLLLLMATGSER